MIALAAQQLQRVPFCLFLWGLLVIPLFSASIAPDNPSGPNSPRHPAKARVENFLLPDLEGKSHELYGQNESRVVVLIFTTTGCPIIQKSVPKIKALRDRFGVKGVVFWLINATPQDDIAAIREEAREFGIDLPILLDRSQTIARALEATRTAEAFCIDPKNRSLLYRGAIDDQLGYGTERKKAGHAYLENALNNFLSGKQINPARTEVRGCRIQFN